MTDTWQPEGRQIIIWRTSADIFRFEMRNGFGGYGVGVVCTVSTLVSSTIQAKPVLPSQLHPSHKYRWWVSSQLSHQLNHRRKVFEGVNTVQNLIPTGETGQAETTISVRNFRTYTAQTVVLLVWLATTCQYFSRVQWITSAHNCLLK